MTSEKQVREIIEGMMKEGGALIGTKSSGKTQLIDALTKSTMSALNNVEADE